MRVSRGHKRRQTGKNRRYNFVGFTIVEVMIVLAISALLLVTTSTVFSGRRQSTEFSQAVYDIQSQFQSWSSSVTSGNIPGVGDYTCAVNASGSGPVLTYSPGSGSTGQNCIYLGLALETLSGGGTIYAYPVFGLRTVHSGGVDTGVFPSSAAQANPDPPLNSSGSLITQLVSSYTPPDSLKIISATASSTGAENDLLTLYSSLQNSNLSGNEVSATGLAKTITTDSPSTVQSCIEGQASCNVTKTPFVNNVIWNLCVTDGSRKAKLSVKGVPTGITTNLDMNGTGC